MDIIAKCPCYIAGMGVVAKGDRISLKDELVDSRIRDNFTMSDGSHIVLNDEVAQKRTEEILKEKEEKNGEENRDALIEKTLKDFGIDGLRQRLEDLHISYSKHTQGKKLAEMYLMNIGEL